MYIKSVKMQGFKSFADRIDLDFESGIMAIVGPNGSGKSNVVDAILWVLGEQSVKQLRGDSQMSDVIFSGSKTREEAKKAYVSIVFDNTDHKLPIDVNEVEIKRVIFTNGENEYYLNGAKVRLKDISDLLIDTTSKFNIITQGNINALVENKSSERRVLFESAAGVLKYKKRKEESLKKLDGTKENLTRINLIIKELLTTLKPLEKEKNDAEEYLKIKKDLENIEIALLAFDIEKYMEDFEGLKFKNTTLKNELDNIKLNHPMNLEKMKLEKIKLDELIQEENAHLFEFNKEESDLESQKKITIERAKFSLDKESINNNLLALNENEIEINKVIAGLNTELTSLKKDLIELTKNYNDNTNEELKEKIKLNNINNEYIALNKEIYVLNSKINVEKDNLENNLYVPKQVKSILSNPRLMGIHNIIGNLININESHLVAINAALGSATNYIVVDDTYSAKKAIIYLKENKLGKATFYPIDTIKSRHISKEIVYTLESLPGYIGIASDLIHFNKKYKDIIENQLGNVVIANSLDDLESIAKVVDYKYKIVSLDGDIIYPGGSMFGGAKEKEHNAANELNILIKDYNEKKNRLVVIENSINTIEKNYNNIKEKINDNNEKITNLKIFIDAKENELNKQKTLLKNVLNDIKSFNNIEKNDVNKEIDKLLKNIGKIKEKKAICENTLNDLKGKKIDLESEIENLEKEISKQNSEYHHIENEINQNEIEISKDEVKIDNLLNYLSENYNITYEYASQNYFLSVESNIARDEVGKLKNKLKGLSNINTGSISEYERVKKRYDFLNSQKEDLENSSKELLKIIEEMDNIMKEKFKTTFDSIAGNFTRIFRTMFKGGNGLLKLTDENDLLNTGINILAVPPGKKLNSTASLSGGEKALTAICLIFSILCVKKAPFIILDEVEAALDEENVNMFGEYLSQMKESSQFILITHKKKMMEYADILYGVTMEESGVSKLVSVKLEDNK